MDNRVNEIRRVIRALRVSMREAEAIMREQINRDEDCTFVAQEVMKMRTVMSGLVKEKAALGDSEPIFVNGVFILHRQPAARVAHLAKLHLAKLHLARPQAAPAV